ncbi:hypothetical protein JXJ21_00750 [candidate division KSB1 bacterium]|nr:hypothetical protein [candidate division KSB1 bacterium]
MIIEATTPARIDLAGGTVDVFPLYLLTEGGMTVNAAINWRCKVRIETRDDKAIEIHSLDLGEKERFSDVDAISFGGKLDLIKRVIKFYHPAVGANVSTDHSIPKGSGLGASSSLLIALSCALNELNQSHLHPNRIIDYGANIELQCIRVLTGKQDYFAAMYGGINALTFDARGSRRERLMISEETFRSLSENIVLSFAGTPRFSGTTNWNLVRQFIENTGTTVENVENLKRNGLLMRECLIAGDLDRFVELIRVEWENRKLCAAGVSNVHIDRMIEEAEKNGARASKLCGAGGGGCMITYVLPENREQVIESLKANNARIMDFEFDMEGVKLKTSYYESDHED